MSEKTFSEVMFLSKKHNVLPIVCETLSKKYGKEDFFQNEKFLSIARYSAQTRKTEKFLKVYRSLRESGIMAICVKGITLRSLYKNGELRPSSDEDLLIKPEDFPTFEKVMEENGLKLLNEASNEETYFDKTSMLIIEAHEKLFFESGELGKNLDAFFESPFCGSHELIINNMPILTLGVQSGLLYLVCHAFKHFIRCGVGIRQVCDIAVYIRTYKNEIDFERLKDDLSKINAEKFFEGLVNIAVKYLGFEDIAFLQSDRAKDDEALLDDILRAGIYGRGEESRIHSAGITLSAVTDKKEHGKIKKVLFPERKVLSADYPSLKRFPVLYPWFSFLRIEKYIFSVAFKKENAGTPRESIRIAKERTKLFKLYEITGKKPEDPKGRANK
ncbi:MAG: nucleotidyltransferase family protein [Clostridia bacterium]|nr:nucleotidyltransferase family protein [Clostridia bacterium]